MKQRINVLPAPTFRWLKMNDAAVDGEALPRETQEIRAAAGTSQTLFLSAGREESSAHCFLTLEEGARIDLIQIISDAGDEPLVQEIEAVCGERAQLHVFWIFTGGKAVYPSVRVRLDGDESSFALDGAYIVRPFGTLDLNIVSDHYGRNTQSHIQMRGVLYDHAKKVFRGTIDFKQGCKGAQGDEREEVLLMDDEAVNQTIPLILCAEEDVAGNHGASIGRIDEEEQFYMASRGLSTEEIEEILLTARIRDVIGKMPREARARATEAAGLAGSEEEETDV